MKRIYKESLLSNRSMHRCPRPLGSAGGPTISTQRNLAVESNLPIMYSERMKTENWRISSTRMTGKGVWTFLGSVTSSNSRATKK